MPDFLTTEQAAERLGVHRASVLRFVEEGMIPVAMTGPGRTGAKFFNPKAVECLAKKRAAEAAA